MLKKRLLALSLLLFSALSAFDYELSVAAIFRDEGPYLKEWIEFHRLVGVEHFYLYNNLSKDRYLEVLQPYIDAGIVDLVDVPLESSTLNRWNVIQSSAYTQALKKAQNRSKWLAVIDIDEYIVPVEDRPLPELLKDYQQFAGLAVNWVVFGTSHVQKIPPDRLMIETLVRRAPLSFVHNTYVKLIVQPLYVNGMPGPHTCARSSSKPVVTPSFMPITKKKSPYHDIGKIRINHYWTKDEDFLYNVKLKRRNMGVWLRYIGDHVKELNNETDDLILRYVPALRDRVFSEIQCP